MQGRHYNFQTKDKKDVAYSLEHLEKCYNERTVRGKRQKNLMRCKYRRKVRERQVDLEGRGRKCLVTAT